MTEHIVDAVLGMTTRAVKNTCASFTSGGRAGLGRTEMTLKHLGNWLTCGVVKLGTNHPRIGAYPTLHI